ncbi:hypothetical protein [Mesorhizobium sp. CN2-181]|uniref:hypothetical protein n=1 Tax=Mesorhizobium yinganensis TaxID=3157707 RepID=UPI0032B79CA1
MFAPRLRACGIGYCGLIVQVSRCYADHQSLVVGVVSADSGIAQDNEDEAVAAEDQLKGYTT